MQNVLVSLQICEIKNQKEWHWPPNIKKKEFDADFESVEKVAKKHRISNFFA